MKNTEEKPQKWFNGLDPFAILERVRLLAEEWQHRSTRDGEACKVANYAHRDFYRLQTDIEKSIDEMTEGLLKQEQEKPVLGGSEIEKETI